MCLYGKKEIDSYIDILISVAACVLCREKIICSSVNIVLF